MKETNLKTSKPLKSGLQIVVVYMYNSHKDIKARLGKARGAFARLQPVWKSKQFSLGTKLRLYSSVVKPVLLYGAECWRVIKSDMNKINAFHNGCLRRICRIFWPNKISNKIGRAHV